MWRVVCVLCFVFCARCVDVCCVLCVVLFAHLFVCLFVCSFVCLFACVLLMLLMLLGVSACDVFLTQWWQLSEALGHSSAILLWFFRTGCHHGLLRLPEHLPHVVDREERWTSVSQSFC